MIETYSQYPLTFLILGLIIIFVIIGSVFFVKTKNSKKEDIIELSKNLETLIQSQNSLTGRLTQLSENQQASHSLLTERIHKQEVIMTKTLGEQLNNVSEKLSQGLEKTNTKTASLMGDIQARLSTIDTAQKQITTLSNQVIQLQDVLTNKQARGAFGEIQLRDLVEAILPPSQYKFQHPIGQADVGRSYRVDCLIELPNPPGPMAIDAKFPLEGYHLYRNAKDDTERTKSLKLFAQSVIKHINDISEKYIVPGETADSALMFVPSEAVYAEIHASLPDVVAKSYQAKVFLTSPTTLWATLNTVRAILKDVKMREQAHFIQKEVLNLINDIKRLDDRVTKLQRHFDLSLDDMRQIRISTDKIGKRGERIENIHIEEEASDKNLFNAQQKIG